MSPILAVRILTSEEGLIDNRADLENKNKNGYWESQQMFTFLD